MQTTDIVWDLFRVAPRQEDAAKNYTGPAVWNEERSFSSARSGVAQALGRLHRDGSVSRHRYDGYRSRGPAPWVWQVSTDSEETFKGTLSR